MLRGAERQRLVETAIDVRQLDFESIDGCGQRHDATYTPSLWWIIEGVMFADDLPRSPAALACHRLAVMRADLIAASLALSGRRLRSESITASMQKFGVEKRDILVKRVREARKSQQEAKEEFQSALDKFRSVIEVEGSPLEDKYNTLNKELERSESRANQVRERVAAVRDVSKDLFKEWEKG